MAGEWIKVEVTTPDKPELMKLARVLKIERDAVFGKLVRLWGWFDKNSVDGVVDGVVSTDIDDLVDLPGFTSAVAGIGWLELDEQAERVTLPNFDRHNGETAKKRALKTRRQQNWRQNRDGDVDGEASTGASTREEKRREEVNTPKGGADAPDPVKEIFDSGIRVLTHAGEKQKPARALIGRLRQKVGDAEALNVIRLAASKSDPQAYIAAAANKPKDVDPLEVNCI